MQRQSHNLQDIMNRKSNFEIGREYYLRREYEEAVKWFEKGVLRDSTASLGWLGHCYEYGLGVAKDLYRAKDLYQSCENFRSICYQSDEFGVWLQERLDALKDIPVQDSERRFIDGIGNVKVMKDSSSYVPIKVRYNKNETVIQVSKRNSLISGFLYAENTLPELFSEWTCDGVNKFHDGYTLETDFFTLKIIAAKVSDYKSVIDGRNLTIHVPDNLSFNHLYVQVHILKKVKEILFKRAEIVIPEKLREVADRTGTSFKKCKVVMTNRSWLAKNCYKDSLIEFCAKSVQLPEKSLEALCIHELAHNFVQGHGSEFRKKMIELGGKEAIRLDMNLFQEGRWPYIRF